LEPNDIRTNRTPWLHLAQDRDQWRTVQNTAIGPVADCSEHGNRTSFYIKYEAFLDRLSNVSMDS